MEKQSKPSSESSHSPQIDGSRATRKFERFLGMYDIKERYNMNEQPSHSPTEQPGDAKHTPGPWEQMNVANPDRKYDIYLTGPNNEVVCNCYTSKANAELIARAPDLLSEVSTLRSKQAELVAEMNRMKHYNLDAKREMASLNETIITLEAELEQLRSERDKRGKWISVDENPPAYTGQEYFRQAEGELIPIFVTDGKTSWIGNKSGDIYMFKALFPTVTHWMEIELPTSALSGGSKQ